MVIFNLSKLKSINWLVLPWQNQLQNKVVKSTETTEVCANNTTKLTKNIATTSNQQAANKAMEPSESELAEIKATEYQILTSPDGPAPITYSQSKLIVLIKHANKLILLVAKSQATHHDVSSVKSLLQRKKITWHNEYLVGLNIIRSIYANSGLNLSEITIESNKTVAMERVFIELLSDAVKQSASDIHVFVQKYETKISFRVDGILATNREFNAAEGIELCQAAFAMADTSDPTYISNEQQSARINGDTLKSMKFKDGVESLRLQFNPLAGGGRHMVVRILYDQKLSSEKDIDALGYSEFQIEQIKRMRQRTTGINIISGPTGSGKSTTLQRGLSALMRERPGISTLTIEDPPEYIIEGAAQIPVTNAKTNSERAEKFNIAIAGALRSDPNTIMIGEIRDKSSAKLAFEAAMTGHSVWTTLHANSAISIIDRLLDLEVEPYKLSDVSNISGLISQRLVKRINPANALSFDEGVQHEFIDSELEHKICELGNKMAGQVRFTDTTMESPSPMEHFSGRTVVAEIIVPDQEFLNYLQQGNKIAAKKHWIESLEGLTMLEHGLLRMLQGEIDPREIQQHFGKISHVDLQRVQAFCEQNKSL